MGKSPRHTLPHCARHRKDQGCRDDALEPYSLGKSSCVLTRGERRAVGALLTGQEQLGGAVSDPLCERKRVFVAAV